MRLCNFIPSYGLILKRIAIILLFLSALVLSYFGFIQNTAVEKASLILSRRMLYFENVHKERKKEVCAFDACYEVELNDKVKHYLEESFLKGTQQFLRRKKDIIKLVESGVLVEIQENEYFVLDTMWYSYPFLTPDAKELLDEIGQRFQRKLENTGLECTRFTITSMLRTTSSVAYLRKWNRNSIKNSAHLHGTTFDISYKSFHGTKELTKAECMYLGDALSKTIWELRYKKKCWATYETWQTCLHVVCR